MMLWMMSAVWAECPENAGGGVLVVHEDRSAAGLYRMELLEALREFTPPAPNGAPHSEPLEWPDLERFAAKNREQLGLLGSLRGYADLTPEQRANQSTRLVASTSSSSPEVTAFVCSFTAASSHLYASYELHGDIDHVSLELWPVQSILPLTSSFLLTPKDRETQRQDVRQAVQELFPEVNQPPTVVLTVRQATPLGPREVVVRAGGEREDPTTVQVLPGIPVELDASQSADVETRRDRLEYRWFSGVDGTPVATAEPGLHVVVVGDGPEGRSVEVHDGLVSERLDLRLEAFSTSLEDETEPTQELVGSDDPVVFEVTAAGPAPKRFAWTIEDGRITCENVAVEVTTGSCAEVGPGRRVIVLTEESRLELLGLQPGSYQVAAHPAEDAQTAFGVGVVSRVKVEHSPGYDVARVALALSLGLRYPSAFLTGRVALRGQSFNGARVSVFLGSMVGAEGLSITGGVGLGRPIRTTVGQNRVGATLFANAGFQAPLVDEPTLVLGEIGVRAWSPGEVAAGAFGTCDPTSGSIRLGVFLRLSSLYRLSKMKGD